MRGGYALVAACLILVGCGGASSTSESSAGSNAATNSGQMRGAVTMHNARRVLVAVWAAREKARTSDDAGALRPLDAGVELEQTSASPTSTASSGRGVSG